MKNWKLLLTLLIIFPGWVQARFPRMDECFYNYFRIFEIPDHCTYEPWVPMHKRSIEEHLPLKSLCIGSIQCEARGFGGPTFHFPSIMCRPVANKLCPSPEDCLRNRDFESKNYKFEIENNEKFYRYPFDSETVPVIVEE